jgi:tetratricopeptide (TPR) repeat protein
MMVFLLCLPAIADAQTDAQLAQQYMNNGEYDKAADIYKKLYNENPTGYYKNYYKCLLVSDSYDELKKLIEKQLKKTPENLTLYVDMGYVYEKQGNTKARDEQYQKAIDNIKDTKQQVIQLANAFLMLDLIDHAIEAYEKGKRNVAGYSFNYEIAGLIYRKGDLAASLNYYLDYFGENQQIGF